MMMFCIYAINCFQAVMPMPAATGRMVTPTSMPMVPTSHGAQSSQSHQHSLFSKSVLQHNYRVRIRLH